MTIISYYRYTVDYRVCLRRGHNPGSGYTMAHKPWYTCDMFRSRYWLANSISLNIHLEISEVKIVIKCIDVNKTCGMDGVDAEHLKRCDKRIVPLPARCVTALGTWIYT